MEKEHEIKKVYELIERFDFEELSESEKSFVLNHISYTEYNNMRSTIVDTNELFSKFPEPGQKDKLLTLKKVVAYPIELYKIAAVIILFIGIGYTISNFKKSSQKELLAMVDTVYIEKTDTIVIEKTDTIEVIKDKIVYKDLIANQNLITQTNNAIETESYESDCSRDICPDDMDLLCKIKTKSDFSKDTSLTEFIVSPN